MSKYEKHLLLRILFSELLTKSHKENEINEGMRARDKRSFLSKVLLNRVEIARVRDIIMEMSTKNNGGKVTEVVGRSNINQRLHPSEILRRMQGKITVHFPPRQGRLITLFNHISSTSVKSDLLPNTSHHLH